MNKEEFLRKIRKLAHLDFTLEGGTDHWYNNSKLQVFNCQTPKQLIDNGRSGDLFRYLQSLEAGALG